MMHWANTAIAFAARTETQRNVIAARCAQAFEIGNGIGIHAQWMGG